MTFAIFALLSAAMVAGASAQGVVMRGSSAAEDLINGLIKDYATGSFTYEPEGSGAGQDYVSTGQGALGFGDVPFDAPVEGVYQMPIALGSIAVYVNTGGVAYPAGLSAQNICDIYEGTVKSWTEIDASLPDVAPTPVARMDSSGSTSVFTEWLTKACSSFAPGQGQEVTWAAGVQLADGTGGVIDAVAATPGAIGYASCARDSGDASEVALINASGSPVTCEGADYAGLKVDAPASAADDWSAVSPVNLEGPKAFPMPFILYAYLASDLSTFGEEGTAVTGFLEYVIGADVTKYDFYTAPKSLLDISSAALTEVGMSG